MNVAITGGTGFLGRVLVRMLVPKAESVRVLVRREADDAAMHALGATPVRGDLTTADGCDGLVRPGDVVIHTAARVDMTGTWAEFHATTVEGTRRLLEAALPKRPARFVYVSSAGVYSARQVLAPASDEIAQPEPPRHNLYGRAKLAAENLVRTECDRAGVSWTILRIGFLYGPGNRALLRHFVPLLERGRLYVVGRGENRIASLYVDDAARAIVLAAEHPAADRKVYNVASDERVTQRQYVNATAEALGFSGACPRAPFSLAWIAVSMGERLAALRGRPPIYTRSMVALMHADQTLDTGRIRRELGWRPEVRFEEGMRRTREWRRGREAAEAPGENLSPPAAVV